MLKKLNAHIWERSSEEHYVEPSWCSERLFQEEPFEGIVHDPCCGFGTIPKAAIAEGLQATGSDLVDRGYDSLEKVIDFIEDYTPRDNIVCNPPFNIADTFTQHALIVARSKVSIIFPVARLNAAHWMRVAPLRRIWLLTPRPSMPPGHVIAAGGKPGGGKMDYCWAVFEQGYIGAVEMVWLKRNIE